MAPRKLTPVPTATAGLSGFKMKEVDRAIFTPIADPHFYIDPRHEEFLDSIEAMSRVSPVNVVFTGPQGCGKTELAISLAARNERPCLVMNCSTIRETKDWFGFRDAKNGSVFWHQSDFVRAVTTGNCVVILDEFNRLHTTLHNSLYPLLDARRTTWVEDLDEVVQVGPGTIFVAVMNVGYAFTGTHTLDAAMNDRFTYRLDLDFQKMEVEAKIIHNKTGILPELASKLAQFGRDIRKKASGTTATLQSAVSTRQLLAAAMLMKELQRNGRPAAQALDFTILPYFSKEGGVDSEQAQVLQLIQGIFGAYTPVAATGT